MVTRELTCEHLHTFKLCLHDLSVVKKQKCASMSTKFVLCQSQASHQSFWSSSRICFLAKSTKELINRRIGTLYSKTLLSSLCLFSISAVRAYRLQTYLPMKTDLFQSLLLPVVWVIDMLLLC